MHVKKEGEGGKKERDGAQAAWIVPPFAFVCFAFHAKHVTKLKVVGFLLALLKMFCYTSKIAADKKCSTATVCEQPCQKCLKKSSMCFTVYPFLYIYR